MMQFHRGIRGHETFVWCSALSRNDIVIHLHKPWWYFFSKLSFWTHREDDDAHTLVAYPVKDLDAMMTVMMLDTWLEVAAFLRASLEDA